MRHPPPFVLQAQLNTYYSSVLHRCAERCCHSLQTRNSLQKFCTNLALINSRHLTNYSYLQHLLFYRYFTAGTVTTFIALHIYHLFKEKKPTTPIYMKIFFCYSFPSTKLLFAQNISKQYTHMLRDKTRVHNH